MTDRTAEPASHLARDSAIVGLATVASRLLGFVRDVLIARALGAGPIADAFLVAFRLPNMFRRVLGEGGLNAPFVPVYLSLKTHEGDAEARRFAGEAIGNFAAILLLIVGLSELIAPWLVLGLAGGFRDAPLTFALAQNYTRLALPFVGFTVLASLVAAILNAERRFAVAALAPIMLNLVLITSLLWDGHHDQPAFRVAKNLAWCVSLAGALHLLLVFWALGWKPPRIPPIRLGWSPAMRRLVRLGVPALLASATAQFVLLVATQIASSQPGAVSWLYYADRVFQLPLGFVAVAMGVVLLPEIAAREAESDEAGRRATVSGALALGLMLAIPAATALAVLAEPIVAVLFERGRFGPVDRERTAAALAAFAVGLPGAVIAKVLAQVYFARQNPGKPLAVGLVSIGTAALGGMFLAPGMPATGAALAASLAFWTQSLLLALWLVHDRLWAPGLALLRLVLIGATAAALMGVAVTWLGAGMSDALIGRQAGLREFALLTGLCAAGLGVYAAAAWAFGALRTGLAIHGIRKSAP
ncbi:MAG: murein biosynthesis integral membrane protein MurJ [Bosea sp.]|jgi:putative peptidoglycan lipid II flippase|nr:murein biosynthesis integral membrane protein MurJ [Bosea sp. (in: a-proteobacteria)]